MNNENPNTEAKTVPIPALALAPCWASECGRVVLYRADCRDVLPIAADAIVTDPPYGFGYASKPMPVMLKSGERIEHHAAQTWDDIPAENVVSLAYGAKWVIIWGGNYYALPPSRCWLARYKPDAAPSMADMELAWTNADRNAKLLTYTVAAMRESGEGRHHPTQKPVRVMSWSMEKVGVPEGATVLDPYMGSGTTGIACIRTGRNFIGIEKDPAHFQTAVERIQRELSQGDLFLGSPNGSHEPRGK